MRNLLTCQRDSECPWTVIVEAAYPVKGEADRERHHAAHDRKAASAAVWDERRARAAQHRELKAQRREVRAQRRALEGSVERTTVRAGQAPAEVQAERDEARTARTAVPMRSGAVHGRQPARTTPLDAMRETPAGASRSAGRGETNGRGDKVAHATPRGTGMPRRGEDDGGRSKAIKESDAAAPTASSNTLAVATPCPMCALDIFHGHGHLRSDGTVTRESTIRWAA